MQKLSTLWASSSERVKVDGRERQVLVDTYDPRSNV